MRRVLHYIGSFLRGLALVILISLISLLLILGVLLAAVTLNVTNGDKVKSWLLTPQVYELGVEAFGALGQQDFDEEEGSAGGEELFLDAQTQQRLLDEFFTFEFYQRAGNEIIGGFYGWMSGETDQPEFNVPITENREELIELLAIFFQSKIEALPECPPGYQIPEGESILSSHCRPAEFDPADTEAILAAAAADARLEPLLENAAIDSANIDLGQIKNREIIPRVFQAVRWLPWLLLAALAVLTLLIVLVVYNWRRGLKTVSLTVLPLSSLFLIVAIGVWLQQEVLIDTISRLAAQEGSAALGALSKELVAVVMRDILLSFIILHALLLAASLLVLTEPRWWPRMKLFGRRHKHIFTRRPAN